MPVCLMEFDLRRLGFCSKRVALPAKCRAADCRASMGGNMLYIF